MPIKIDDRLPAKESLEQENIFVMTNSRADSQNIRPLKIIILNLMPTKIATETQLLRVLSNSPLQVDVELLQTATHKASHVDENHMLNFYKTFDEIKNNKYDGMIITGAPVEQMKFEEVDYWQELCTILDWADKNVYSTFNICWGAQAALYHKYGIPKYPTDKKVFGVFKHKLLDPFHPLLRGFDDEFCVPQSRHTQTKMEDVLKCKDLQILSYSEESGIHLISDYDCRHFYTTGHSEYDANTLADEYFRDLKKGLNIDIPKNYFPNDDPTQKPIMSWRTAGTLLYTNWLNYFVYQKTPYDISDI